MATSDLCMFLGCHAANANLKSGRVLYILLVARAWLVLEEDRKKVGRHAAVSLGQPYFEGNSAT